MDDRWTEQELLHYEAVQKAVMDMRSAVITAKQEERNEGIEIGVEKGIEKIALTMLSQGLPAETIMVCTQLSREQIEAMRDLMCVMSFTPSRVEVRDRSIPIRNEKEGISAKISDTGSSQKNGA